MNAMNNIATRTSTSSTSSSSSTTTETRRGGFLSSFHKITRNNKRQESVNKNNPTKQKTSSLAIVSSSSVGSTVAAVSCAPNSSLTQQRQDKATTVQQLQQNSCNSKNVNSSSKSTDSYTLLLESLIDSVLSMIHPTTDTPSSCPPPSSSTPTPSIRRSSLTPSTVTWEKDMFHESKRNMNTVSTTLGTTKNYHRSMSTSSSSTMTTSMSSSISSSSTSSSSLLFSTWTRTDILQFLTSFPIRYTLHVQYNPTDIVLHMSLYEDVKIHGPCYASIHVSTDVDSATSSSFGTCCMLDSSRSTNLNHNPSELSSACMNNNTVHNNTPYGSHNDDVKRKMKHIKAFTILSPHMTGLLEFIISLWEASGSDIFDCNILVSKESMVLIQAIVLIKGGFKVDSLQNQINNFLRICGGLLPEKNFSGPTISTRFGSPDPSTVPITHLHPLYQRNQVIMDEMNVGYQFFDPYDHPPIHPTSSTNDGHVESDRPDQARKKRLNDAYLKTPTLLYELIGLRGYVNDNHPPHSNGCHEEMKKPSEAIDPGSKRSMSLGGGSCSDHSVGGGRRKLVSRSASVDLDQSVSTKASYHFFVRNNIDSLPRIMVTATIKASLSNRVYQGYLIREGEDTVIDSFQGDKSLFEHQPGLLAIKVAHLSKDIDCTKTLEDLVLEGDIAMTLDHINLCKLVTQYRSPQIVLLAYEYCSKGSLCSIIRDDTKTYDYLPLALDIAQGMAYLHSKGIIHRDLKPSNIFVDRNNRVKIADFGMCTANTGEVLKGETGTYRWMAPEIIRHEPYSTKADVYSFGICLWQLVTRCTQPFCDMNPIQAAYAVTKGERPFIPYNTPDFIRQIITACWEDDQLKRPSFANIYLGLSAYSNISCQQDYSI